MKQIISVLFLILSVYPGARAQQDSGFALIKKIKGDIVAFAADHLDNIYLLNSSDQLKKLDAKGDSVAVFNNVRKYGKVSCIDVSNPLRVLLYYKDFTTVVMLDRLLNTRTTIDLRQQNIFQVRAIGLSYDNKIWLYDEVEHKLKKIDEDGKLLFETSDFRQLFDEAFSFSSIFDQDALLYLYDEQKGVLVFDYFGMLKRKIPLAGLKNFKPSGKYLLGTKNDTLIRYQQDIFFTKETLLPSSFRQSRSIGFTNKRIYALKKEELEIYEWK
jgi:hypothetical protein